MADDELTVAVLAGTTRPERQSIHAARLVAEVGRRRHGVRIVFVDPIDFSFPGDGNDPGGKDPRYSAITAEADAFYIVTPEYNHSVPGSLKRMLDSELGNYMHKPVAFASASAKAEGGVRAIEALTLISRELGLVATGYDVVFPKVGDLFDGHGELPDDQRGRYERYIGQAYDELLWFARLLKRAR